MTPGARMLGTNETYRAASGQFEEVSGPAETAAGVACHPEKSPHQIAERVEARQPDRGFISDNKPADQHGLQHSRNHRPPEGGKTEPRQAEQRCCQVDENSEKLTKREPLTSLSIQPPDTQSLLH